MLQKIERSFLYIILITLPIMSVINYFNLFKMNTALSDIFTIFIMVIFLFKLKHIKIRLIFPFAWYFIGLIIITALSNIVANKMGLMTGGVSVIISEILKVCICASYFYVGWGLLNDRDNLNIIKIFNIWLISTWIVFIVGIFIQINFFMGKIINFNTIITPSRGRLMGTMTDANITATYMGISFVISYILLLSSKNKQLFIYYGLSLIITFLGVLLTFSRGGLISFIGAVFFIVIYEIVRNKHNLKRLLTIAILTVSALILFIDIDYTIFSGNITKQFSFRIEQLINKTEQYNVRTNLAQVSFEMGKDYPILGVGRGNFVANSEDYFRNIGGDYPMGNYGLIPHNTILGYLAETGIIGLALFISLPLIVLTVIIKNKSWVNFSFFCIFIQMAIHSLSINIENFRGLWLIMGLFFAFNYNNYTIDLTGDLNVKQKTAILPNLISVVVFLILFIDISRKIPNNHIYTKPFSIVTILNKDTDYYLNYYIKHENENPCIIKIDYEDKQKNVINSVEYKYFIADGFVDEKLSIPQNTYSTKISVFFNNRDKGKVILRDMAIVESKYNTTDNLLRKTYLLPKLLEKLCEKAGILYDYHTKKEELLGKDILESDEYIDNASFYRSGLYSSVLSYDVANTLFENNNLKLSAYLIEKNINNIPDDLPKNGIIQFNSTFNTDDGNQTVFAQVDRSLYDEHYELYVRITDKNNSILCRSKNLNYIKNNDYIKIESINSPLPILIEQTTFATNGYHETTKMLLDKGVYKLTVNCYGSDYDGEYPLVKVEDYNKNLIADNFYVTGDMLPYEFPLIYISEDNTPMSFLVWFLNDAYYNNNGIVKDRNLYINSIIFEKTQ